MRTNRTHALRVAALLLLAASVYACSDSPTDPGDSQPANLSDVLNEASDPFLAGAGGRSAPVPLPSFASVPPSSCTYDASSQSFVCPRITADGLTIDHAFTLLDAAGNTQSQFSSTSTAAVRTTWHLTGTSSYSSGTMTMDGVDDRTVSGLLTSRHVLNGTSTSTMEGTFTPDGSAPVPTRGTHAMKIENLVLPSRTNQWPGPGTVTSDGTSSFGAWPPTTSRMVAVFNGTKCVVISLIAGGSTESLTIDLSNPGATGCKP